MARPAELLAVLALVLTACTSSVSGPDAQETPAASAPAEASGTPSPPESPARSEEPDEPEESATPRPRPRPVSLPALFEKEYNGGGLRIGRLLLETDTYTEHFATYRSGRLRISARLAVPRGRGPHPALVLAHGYIDPSFYVNGQGLTRERGWLAAAGYVVLHSDYRNHAASSAAPDSERRMRLGYTEDVINAVHALHRTDDIAVDDERIGLLGRSMGGGVVYNVVTAQPGLVDAAVAFAPVSSRAIDNFNRWIRNDDDSGDAATSDFILNRYGEPADNPRFWRQLSARTYFDRVSEPVLIHHGTSDDSCPIRWSRATLRAMRASGVDARMHTYPGEEHAFGPQFGLSMRRTVAFFRSHLAE